MPKIIDLQNLKVLSRHNLSFVREILEVYLSNTPRDMSNLAECVEKEEWNDVRYYAHKLKSSSFTIGFDSGYKVYQEMETLIKEEGDMTEIPPLMAKAKSLCDQALVEVKIELTEYL